MKEKEEGIKEGSKPANGRIERTGSRVAERFVYREGEKTTVRLYCSGGTVSRLIRGGGIGARNDHLRDLSIGK